MASKAPGKAHRKGISLIEITAMFPTDEAAEKWIAAQRWPDGPTCPYCGSLNVQAGIKHRSMTHRCRDCSTRPMFSLKTGTVMHRTQLGYREWAHRHLPAGDQSQGRVEHEAASRPEHHAEVGMVSGPSSP